MQRRSVVDGTDGPAIARLLLSDIQTGFGVGRQRVRKGEHGTKVYFVKQLHVHDQGIGR